MKEISTIRTKNTDLRSFRSPFNSRRLAVEMEDQVFDCWTDEGRASQKEVQNALFSCGFSIGDMTVIPMNEKESRKSQGSTAWHAKVVATDSEKLKAVHQYLAFRKWTLVTWKS